MERMALTIEGMSCGHCVRAVDRALQGLSGVQVEKVGMGSAVVAYDPATAKPEQIMKAISDAGYEAHGVRAGS